MAYLNQFLLWPRNLRVERLSSERGTWKSNISWGACLVITPWSRLIIYMFHHVQVVGQTSKGVKQLESLTVKLTVTALLLLKPFGHSLWDRILSEYLALRQRMCSLQPLSSRLDPLSEKRSAARGCNLWPNYRLPLSGAERLRMN